ncbi:MAG: Fis family transcriptional regulator, partial [Enterocloster aldenensis]
FVYENKEMEEGQQVSGTTAPGSPRPGSPVPWQQAMEEKGIDPEEYWFVLKVLYQCTEERKAIGREGILECAKKEKFFLSQIGVRTILGILKEYGLARVSRGRGGSRMTCLGREIWENRE